MIGTRYQTNPQIDQFQLQYFSATAIISKAKIRFGKSEILGRILHIVGVSLSHYHYKYMALRKLNESIFDHHGVGGRSPRYIHVNSW